MKLVVALFDWLVRQWVRPSRRKRCLQIADHSFFIEPHPSVSDSLWSAPPLLSSPTDCSLVLVDTKDH